MAQVQVRLLRPLNGQEIGGIAVYDKADADRLAAAGAVQILRAAQKAAAKKAPAPRNKKAPAPANKSA